MNVEKSRLTIFYGKLKSLTIFVEKTPFLPCLGEIILDGEFILSLLL